MEESPLRSLARCRNLTRAATPRRSARAASKGSRSRYRLLIWTHDDAVGRNDTQISVERLLRQQMDGDGIGGEGVEGENVESGLLAFQEEAGVADGNRRVRRAAVEGREMLARQAHDDGVDLVDCAPRPRDGQAGKRSRAKAPRSR